MNALGVAVAPAIGVSIYQMMGYRVSFALALMFSAFTILIIQFISDKGEPRGSVRVKREESENTGVGQKGNSDCHYYHAFCHSLLCHTVIFSQLYRGTEPFYYGQSVFSVICHRAFHHAFFHEKLV